MPDPTNESVATELERAHGALLRSTTRLDEAVAAALVALRAETRTETDPAPMRPHVFTGEITCRTCGMTERDPIHVEAEPPPPDPGIRPHVFAGREGHDCPVCGLPQRNGIHISTAPTEPPRTHAFQGRPGAACAVCRLTERDRIHTQAPAPTTTTPTEPPPTGPTVALDVTLRDGRRIQATCAPGKRVNVENLFEMHVIEELGGRTAFLVNGYPGVGTIEWEDGTFAGQPMTPKGCMPPRYALIRTTLTAANFAAIKFPKTPPWAPAAAKAELAKPRETEGPFRFFWSDDDPGEGAGHGVWPYLDWLASSPDGLALVWAMCLDMQRPVWALNPATGEPLYRPTVKHWQGGSQTGDLALDGYERKPASGWCAWENQLPNMFDGSHLGRMARQVLDAAPYLAAARYMLKMLCADVVQALRPFGNPPKVDDPNSQSLYMPLFERVEQSKKQGGMYAPPNTNPWVTREIAHQVRVLHGQWKNGPETDKPGLKQAADLIAQMFAAQADANGNPCRSPGSGDSGTYAGPPWNVGLPNFLTFQAQFVQHAMQLLAEMLGEAHPIAAVRDKFRAFLRPGQLPYCVNATFETTPKPVDARKSTASVLVPVASKKYAFAPYEGFVHGTLGPFKSVAELYATAQNTEASGSVVGATQPMNCIPRKAWDVQ